MMSIGALQDSLPTVPRAPCMYLSQPAPCDSHPLGPCALKGQAVPGAVPSTQGLLRVVMWSLVIL